MINQQSPVTQSPPIERLLTAADAFRLLPPDASKEDVETSFDQIRSLMLNVMAGSIDAHPYKPSWDTLTTYGDAELAELMAMTADSPAYSDKLTRIKRLVQSSVDCLP